MARPRILPAGVQRVKTRVWHTQGRVDGRKNSAISEKRSAAGKRGRGADIHSVKADPELEKRMDMVVQAALLRQRDANVDVVRGDNVIHLIGLKASRIG